MPGRFINTGTNNITQFKNISNSGKVTFYNAVPEITTTSTTTTTTTGVQVWYTLERCDNNAIIDYSTNYNTGTFAINDIVVYGGALYFRVTGVNSSDPGGSHFSISATGLGSCPTTTTTTTTTTLAPITFSTSITCIGVKGDILVDNFAGGDGDYRWIASGSSEANAILSTYGIGQRFDIDNLTSYTFSNQNNNTYYIAIKDNTGNVGVVGPIGVNCTTTSTTTTTTTLANYEYGVVFCSDSGTGTVVSNIPLTRFNYYYHPSFGCFQVATNQTVVNLPGYNFTSIADCNATECIL
jgi:hypothetical protein